PYGNTTQDAGRLQKDIRQWMDCMGYCYLDDAPNGTYAYITGYTTPTAGKGLALQVTCFGFDIYGVYWSKNPLDPGKYDYSRAGTNTNVSDVCDMPFDIYRKAHSGAIVYGINYKGEIKYPPFTGLLTKRECGFLDQRHDDCNRPAGGFECYYVPLDTPICNYYLSVLQGNGNALDKLWINGVNIIPTGYLASGITTNRKLQDLSDTCNRYLRKMEAFGKVSVNNYKGTTYGYKITAKWSSVSFDSAEIPSGTKHYFQNLGCYSGKFYSVLRNELGGITSCTDEHGDQVYLPENAIKIICDESNDIIECTNKNRTSVDVLGSNATKIFKLNDIHSIYVKAVVGTTVMSSTNMSGTSQSINLPAGHEAMFTAEDKCKYFTGGKTITVTTQATSSAFVLIVW
ncbi:MAG: hypothetical protein M3Q56_11390, partial [Bacteroidota bacterium]|nr:hypothetical protein [Bacteroidota bacterium]